MKAEGDQTGAMPKGGNQTGAKLINVEYIEYKGTNGIPRRQRATKRVPSLRMATKRVPN